MFDIVINGFLCNGLAASLDVYFFKMSNAFALDNIGLGTLFGFFSAVSGVGGTVLSIYLGLNVRVGLQYWF